MRTKVRTVARWLMVLIPALIALSLTWWLTQHFFHLPQAFSAIAAALVGGSIVTAFGRWVLQEEKIDRSATADGDLNALPGSWVFRIMIDEMSNLADWIIIRMRIHRSGTVLMMTVLVVGLAVAAAFAFPRRAQPPVISSGPSARPPAPTSLASPPAPAKATMRDGTVSEIASSESGMCVEVRDLEKVEYAIIDQGTCQGGANQKFKMLAGVDPGTFKIQALHSGKCMTVINDKRVAQITCADSTQFWRFRWRDTKRGWNYWESVTQPTAAGSAWTCRSTITT